MTTDFIELLEGVGAAWDEPSDGVSGDGAQPRRPSRRRGLGGFVCGDLRGGPRAGHDDAAGFWAGRRGSRGGPGEAVDGTGVDSGAGAGDIDYEVVSFVEGGIRHVDRRLVVMARRSLFRPSFRAYTTHYLHQ